MAGKRYTQEEIKRIVELKTAGKSSDEVSEMVKKEFNTNRTPKVVSIVFDKFKNGVKEQVTA